MANDTTLQIDIKGDAQGAVSAIERTKKKIEELQSRESALKQAMDQLNTSTDEGRRLFAALKAQLDVTEKHMTKLNVASEAGKNFGRKFNDEFGKMGGVLSALGSSTSETGQAIASMAGQSQGLVAAFAEGGPVLAGLTAAAFALSALNDKIDEYIEKAAEAETARIVRDVGEIASVTAPGREAESRAAALRASLSDNAELVALQNEQRRGAAEIATLTERMAKVAGDLAQNVDGAADKYKIIAGVLKDMQDRHQAIDAAIAHEAAKLKERNESEARGLELKAASLAIQEAVGEESREDASLRKQLLEKDFEHRDLWATITKLKGAATDEQLRALAAAEKSLAFVTKERDALMKQIEARKALTAEQKKLGEVSMQGGPISRPRQSVEFLEDIDQIRVGEGETMIIADAVKDASAAELRALEELVGFAQKTSVGVGQLPAKFVALGDQIANALTSVPPEFAGALTGDTSSMGAIGATLGGVVGGPIGSAVGGAAGSTVGEGLDQLIGKLQVFDPLIDSIVNLVMQLEPVWQITADGMRFVASGLDMLAPVVHLIAEVLAMLQTPLSLMYDGLTAFNNILGMAIQVAADVVDLMLTPLASGITALTELLSKAMQSIAHYVAQFLNQLVGFVNVIVGWANNTFGTDFKLLEGVDSVFQLGEASEEAGKQLKESFTNEMANLPPGFKVSSAMFAATSPIADPRGGGMGGMNIGVINVQTTRDLASELDSLRQRTISGSSGIVQGRNSIQDRRN